MLALPLLLVGSSCDRYDPDGVAVAPPCAEQRVDLLRPRRDSDNAYVGSILVAELACVAPEGVLALSGPGGAVDGPVTLHRSDLQRRLRPTEYLEPETTYTGRIDTDAGFRDWSFTTSATGPSVGDQLDLGAAMHPDQGVLLDPPGAGALLVDELAAFQPVLVLGQAEVGRLPARLGARTGAVAEGTQDGSRSTWDLELRWTDPHFRSEPVDLRWRLDSLALVLEDAVLRGGVAPTLDRVDGFSIEAMWDTRDAEGALGDGPGSLCTADVDAGGDGCVPCRDLEIACLPFLLVHAPGQAWPGTLTEVQ